ncbi:DUF2543 family protein [Klebsiella pneumoniae]|nr:DUF2543 family protein [Klebsiella pneumoniae]
MPPEKGFIFFESVLFFFPCRQKKEAQRTGEARAAAINEDRIDDIANFLNQWGNE